MWAGTTLTLVNADGSDSRDLYSGGSVDIIKWTAAGTELLTDIGVPGSDDRRVVRLSVTTGADTELWRYDGRVNLRPDVSPDGRTVVVSRQVSPDERELVSIDVSSGAELWTLPFAGRDAWPRWTPDGQAVVFVNHASTPSLNMLPLNDRLPAAPPAVIRDMGRVADVQLVGFAPDWTLYMNVTPPLRTARVATLNLGPQNLPPSTRPLDTVTSLDTMGADWSPDGQEVAYLQGPFGTRTTLGTVIISDPTSRSRTSITLPGFVVRDGPTVRWSPNGRSLAVLYGDMGDGNEVLAVVDRDTRRVEELVHASEGEEIRWPAWAEDSRHIYFRSSRRRGGRAGWDHSVRRVALASEFPVDDVDLEGLLPGAAGPIDVAPDGSIAMRHLRPGKCVVRIVPPSGEAVDRHEFTGSCTALAWSRDGSSLAVATQTGPAFEGDYSLWMMQRAEGEPVRIPIEGLSRVWDLSFHPNGRELIYTDGDRPFDLWSVKGIPRPR